MTEKCHRQCEETKQSDDIKNTDWFASQLPSAVVILPPRNNRDTAQ